MAVRLALVAVLLASSALADDYRIGPGDVVEIEVWREADLSGEHEVAEDGNLRHELLGEFPAGGLTCDALADALKKRLERDFLREARVTVKLVRSERSRAWVLGAVARPGQYPVGDDSRLLDLLFDAGGLGLDAGQAATLYRMGEPGPGESLVSPEDREPLEELAVDLEALLGGDLTANRGVQPGDVVVVLASEAQARPTRRIRVVGEVERPGTYELAEAPTALDAVLAAGGFTEYASTNRVRLVRGDGDEKHIERLRLGDVVQGRDGARNVALESGDLLVVPESFF